MNQRKDVVYYLPAHKGARILGRTTDLSSSCLPAPMQAVGGQLQSATYDSAYRTL